MDNTIFSRVSKDIERESDCISGTEMSAQSEQMRRIHAKTRVIPGFPAGTVEGLTSYSMPGMMSESLKTEWPKLKKSGESAKNDELWQIPYDNGSLLNVENNKKVVLRSF